MTEIDEDLKSLTPGVVRGRRVAGSVVGVSEMGKGKCLIVAVSELTMEGNGSAVAVRSSRMVAAVEMGVAEAIPGMGFLKLVLQLLGQRESLFAMAEGLSLVAK